MKASGRIVSVNVGRPRAVEYRGKTITTSIWKSPVEGTLRVEGVNITGDDQADRSVHGGPDKAVYAYASEDYAWWALELEREMSPATFGENLTTSGIDVTNAVVGERWRVGTALLEVCQPRTPCFKLGIRMGSQRFPRHFFVATRPGAYLRIIEPGDVTAGAAVERSRVPGHGLTVRDVAHIYYAEKERAAELLRAPQLADSWVRWARQRARTTAK